MQLNDELAKEFQELYRVHFAKEISLEEARSLGLNLISLTKLVCLSKSSKIEKEPEPGGT